MHALHATDQHRVLQDNALNCQNCMSFYMLCSCFVRGINATQCYVYRNDAGDDGTKLYRLTFAAFAEV